MYQSYSFQNSFLSVGEYGSEGRSSRLRSQTAAHKGPENKYRFLSIGLLLTEIGCMIGYGIQGKYFEEEFPSAISYISIISLIMLALFTIVGFGLLLSFYRDGTWLGMASAIIVVAISLQLSPVLQTLWFQTFNTSFRNSPTPTEVGASVQYFWTYYYDGIIDASILKMRTSFLSCISILTLLTAVIGRISLANLVQVVSFFQIAWTLNYNLLIFMATSSRDFNPSEYHSPLVFDTFGSTFIYLFAGFFGITYSCLLGVKLSSSNPRNSSSRFSLTLSLMGTAFIFAAFVFTANQYVVNTAQGTNRSVFAILFGMIGSVIGTYIGSGICGKGKVGFKECLTGTISGGVVIGSVAPVIYNIGIMIMIGVVNGLIVGFYMRTVHRSINSKNVKDSMGLFGPFMISALLGTMVVTCSVLAYAYDHGEVLPTESGQTVPKDLIGWQLVYVGISIGIGLVGGLIAALLSKCGKNDLGVATNHRYFSHDYGLWIPLEGENDRVGYMQTNQHLHDKDLG